MVCRSDSSGCKSCPKCIVYFQGGSNDPHSTTPGPQRSHRAFDRYGTAHRRLLGHCSGGGLRSQAALRCGPSCRSCRWKVIATSTLPTARRILSGGASDGFEYNSRPTGAPPGDPLVTAWLRYPRRSTAHSPVQRRLRLADPARISQLRTSRASETR